MSGKTNISKLSNEQLIKLKEDIQIEIKQRIEKLNLEVKKDELAKT